MFADLLGLENIGEALPWPLPLSPAPATPMFFSLPGVTTVPNENPAQWVLLPSDSDWGTHLQVPKGIQPSELCHIEFSGHIAKIWTLRWEKDTMRETIVPGWKWWLHLSLS